MKFEAFAATANALPVFGNDVLNTLGLKPDYGRLLLHRWSRAGKILRLKKDLYTLPPGSSRVPVSSLWLAQHMYSPSYVSLETALSYHDMIPDAVTRVTSVTPRKTARFDNAFGVFSYHSIKQNLFCGFREIRDEDGRLVLMADREKAVLDYIYFDARFHPEKVYFTHNLRLQQLETLAKAPLKKYAATFGSRKMTAALDVLLKLL